MTYSLLPNKMHAVWDLGVILKQDTQCMYNTIF